MIPTLHYPIGTDFRLADTQSCWCWDYLTHAFRQMISLGVIVIGQLWSQAPTIHPPETQKHSRASDFRVAGNQRGLPPLPHTVYWLVWVTGVSLRRYHGGTSQMANMVPWRIAKKERIKGIGRAFYPVRPPNTGGIINQFAWLVQIELHMWLLVILIYRFTSGCCSYFWWWWRCCCCYYDPFLQ